MIKSRNTNPPYLVKATVIFVGNLRTKNKGVTL